MKKLGILVLLFIFTQKFLYAKEITSRIKNEDNKKDVTIKYKGEKAMVVDNGKEYTNYGNIESSGNIGVQAEGESSIAINRGTIASSLAMEGEEPTVTKTLVPSPFEEGQRKRTKKLTHIGMLAIKGGTVINEKGGEINNSGNIGMKAFIEGKAINEEGGVISNGGDYGMFASGEKDEIFLSKVINKGTIKNSGNFGMLASLGGIATNEKGGVIKNSGDIGMKAYLNGSTATNEGIIENSGNFGMIADPGGNVINKGTIQNGGNFGMLASLGGIATNEKGGIIQNSGNYKMFILHAMGYNYGKITNVTQGQIAVQTINSDFYNSGTIEAKKGIAISMGKNSNVPEDFIPILEKFVLELGTGTKITGDIKWESVKGDIEDDDEQRTPLKQGTLVVSSQTAGEVEVDKVSGFNKLIASKGNVTIKGVYNLDVVKNPSKATYRNKAIGLDDIDSIIDTYSIDDVSGAKGKLIVDGIVNIKVDYDKITKEGTDKTGKIVANSISKTKNGHIYLVNGGETTSNIVDEALKSDANIKEFRIKGIATAKGAMAIDPDFFETTKDTKAKEGWKSFTTMGKVGQNGSILLDQKYYKSTTLKDPFPIPRNRVDLDSMNRLTSVTSSIVNFNTKALKVGGNRVFLDLNTQVDGNFKGVKAYNFDYNVNTNGSLIGYLHQVTSNFSLGAAISYDNSDVIYEGVKIDDIRVDAPAVKHKEQMDSYNTQLFSNYKNNNFNLYMGVGYGLSKHKLNTTFLSGVKKGAYDSKVFKVGVKGSYFYNLSSKYNIALIPSLGIDYINVAEDAYKYDDSKLRLGKTKGGSYVGTVGITLVKQVKDIKWSLGTKYEYNVKNDLYKAREVEDYPLEEKALSYDKGTISVNLDSQFQLTKNLTSKVGYVYENNENYSNNNVHVLFSYKF